MFYSFNNLLFFKFLFGSTATSLGEALVNLHNAIFVHLMFVFFFVFSLIIHFIYIFTWQRKNEFFSSFKNLYFLFDNKKLQVITTFFAKFSILKFLNFFLISKKNFFAKNITHDLFVKNLYINILNSLKKLGFNFEEFSLLYYSRFFNLNLRSRALISKNNYSLLYKQLNNLRTSESLALELLWAFLPICLVIIFFIPSLILLFTQNLWHAPDLSLRVTGNQWFWSFEGCISWANDVYSFVGSDLFKLIYLFSYDLNLLDEESLDEGDLRLLVCDKSISLPIYSFIRLFITSSDVIHSLAVPNFGLKLDTVPGRINSIYIIIDRLFFLSSPGGPNGLLYNYNYSNVSSTVSSTVSISRYEGFLKGPFITYMMGIKKMADKVRHSNSPYRHFHAGAIKTENIDILKTMKLNKKCVDTTFDIINATMLKSILPYKLAFLINIEVDSEGDTIMTCALRSTPDSFYPKPGDTYTGGNLTNNSCKYGDVISKIKLVFRGDYSGEEVSQLIDKKPLVREGMNYTFYPEEVPKEYIESLQEDSLREGYSVTVEEEKSGFISKDFKTLEDARFKDYTL